MNKSKIVLTAVLLSLAVAPVVAFDAGEWKRPERPSRPAEPGQPIRATATDPTGDTFGSSTPQLDLTSISADLFATDMVRLRLEFAGTITTADSGQPNALVGFIEIDSDQSAATDPLGSAYNSFCPSSITIGVEYLVDLGSYSGGMMDLESSGSTILVPATFTSNSVEIEIDSADLGGSLLIDVAAVIGTIPEPTDCAPDGMSVSTPVEVQGFSVE